MILHAESCGQGPVLLFIHGLGSDHLCWDLQVPELSNHFRLVRLDLPGSGPSPDPSGPCSCIEMAGDVAETMQHLGIPSAFVVGHSLGGGVAQCLAAQSPERVAGLVLVGTTTSLEPRALEVLEGWLAWMQEGLSREAFARGFLPWILSRRFFENRLAVAEATRLHVESPWPQSAQAFASQLAACHGMQTTELLSRIQVPALVLTGSEDLLTPPAQGRELAACLTRGRFVQMPDLAHACMGEGASLFNQLVRDFVWEVQPQD